MQTRANGVVMNTLVFAQQQEQKHSTQALIKGVFLHPCVYIPYQGALAVHPLGADDEAADVVLPDARGLPAPVQTPQDLRCIIGKSSVG